MATKVQRTKAVLDTLSDTTITNALAGRVADAFANIYAPGQTLTNEQKARLVLLHIRNFVKEHVRNTEITAAVDSARRTAASTAEINLGEDDDTP